MSCEMCKQKCLWSLVLFGFFLTPSECATKTWIYTNNIINPLNWEGGKPSTGCKGVIFPENLGSVGTIFELYAEELVLPITGELEILEGGYIEISGNEPCLRIKELKHRPWLSTSNWDFGQNAAIPDAEKVPCTHDDAVFPKDDTFSVYYPEVYVSVNSIQIGGLNLNNELWQTFLQTDYGSEQFNSVAYRDSGISVEPAKCTSKSGCTCHYSDDIFYWICYNMEKREEATCFDPITPVGHCSSMCGGIVLLEVSPDFVLDEFANRIPKYEKLDSYASKITKDGKPYVQIVFAEKAEYAELSTAAASDFHSTISGDLKSFRVKASILERSGVPLPQGSKWGSALSIVLGTFVAVSMLAGCLYVVYAGPLEHYRVPFREISWGNMRPLVFAKFDNREEGQMSMAGSMISLQKSFDNPMYGSHRPSTSSAAVDVLNEIEPNCSETTHENLVFTERVEIEDVEEEEE